MRSWAALRRGTRRRLFRRLRAGYGPILSLFL